MKTLLARSLVVLAAAAAVGCGGQATGPGSGGSGDGGSSGSSSGSSTSLPAPVVTMNAGGTIPLAPSAVSANRSPAVCGVGSLPFTNGDVFSMGIVPGGPATPYGLLSLIFQSPMAVGAPTALSVQPFVMNGSQSGTTWYPEQSAKSGAVTFIYSQGTGTSAVDTGAFTSVTFTLLAMPAQDGDPLTLRLQVHFADGKVLDETYSAALVTDTAGCPGG